MTMTAVNDIEDIRKRGREARDLALTAAMILAIWIVIEILIAPILRSLSHHADAITTVARMRDALIDAAPMLVLMWGLWSAHNVFARVSAGDVFTAANAADMREIGLAMIWSSVTAEIISPAVKGFVTHSGFQAGMHGWPLLVAAIGGALLLFGRIWALAVEIKADADQIV